MKPLLLYIKDQNALQNWVSVCSGGCIVLSHLSELTDFPPLDQLVFIQITEQCSVDSLIQLARDGYGVIALSNTPNDPEGIRLFQNGVRGYANTFSAKQRIEQIVATVKSDSVWLGPSIMQAIFQSLLKGQTPKDYWKQSLTEREIEVTERVLQSKSNREIAAELGITERTVKAHLRNVFEKLEVTDRLSLVLKIKNWS
ncbi:MAG: response regulator transcription factor [Thiotrichales bacterium]|nr:response regulator transcription factor [Thiotrichales bacterium]